MGLLRWVGGKKYLGPGKKKSIEASMKKDTNKEAERESKKGKSSNLTKR
jgi:hypothetical protein